MPREWIATSSILSRWLGRIVARISIAEAEGQLSELVRRSVAGDEVILTWYGREVVRLVPVMVGSDRKARRALLEAVRASGAAKARAGPDAARSQDFLYGQDGDAE
jgi:prevent-host-death family protein